MSTVCAQREIEVATRGRGLHEVTREVTTAVADAGLTSGLANVFVQHTSCSLLITENADPDVRGDLERWLERLVADGDALFRHRDEGPDDMSAHVRAALTATSLGIPVRDGRLALGRWQGVFVFEHRTSPHRRRLVVTLLGER